MTYFYYTTIFSYGYRNDMTYYLLNIDTQTCKIKLNQTEITIDHVIVCVVIGFRYQVGTFLSRAKQLFTLKQSNYD